MAAALTARNAGARVVMLEKMAAHGGTSRFAEGMFAAESSLQIKKSIGLTRDQAFKTHMDNTHWYANGRLVRAFIDKSADTIEWLQQLGVSFTEPAAL
jgi:fumarate reductase flavoprotein subunit